MSLFLADISSCDNNCKKMKLALGVLLAISVGVANAVSVSKLFADEWSLFKVIEYNFKCRIVYWLFCESYQGCSFQVLYWVWGKIQAKGLHGKPAQNCSS